MDDATGLSDVSSLEFIRSHTDTGIYEDSLRTPIGTRSMVSYFPNKESEDGIDFGANDPPLNTNGSSLNSSVSSDVPLQKQVETILPRTQNQKYLKQVNDTTIGKEFNNTNNNIFFSEAYVLEEGGGYPLPFDQGMI